MLLSVVTQISFQKKYLIDAEGKSIGVTPKDAPAFFKNTSDGGLLISIVFINYCLSIY